MASTKNLSKTPKPRKRRNLLWWQRRGVPFGYPQPKTEDEAVVRVLIAMGLRHPQTRDVLFALEAAIRHGELSNPRLRRMQGEAAAYLDELVERQEAAGETPEYLPRQTERDAFAELVATAEAWCAKGATARQLVALGPRVEAMLQRFGLPGAVDLNRLRQELKALQSTKPDADEAVKIALRVAGFDEKTIERRFGSLGKRVKRRAERARKR